MTHANWFKNGSLFAGMLMYLFCFSVNVNQLHCNVYKLTMIYPTFVVPLSECFIWTQGT